VNLKRGELRFQCGYRQLSRNNFDCDERRFNEDFDDRRIALVASVIFSGCALDIRHDIAQDVPGIGNLHRGKGPWSAAPVALQSNVDFPAVKTIAKLSTDHAQKLDAANRQIDGLKSAVAGLQNDCWTICQTAAKKAAEDQKKKADAAPAKDAAPGAKEGGK